MTIDIRANVTCNLGTLISASLSDDYIQGSGLIKTRGSCQISGLINPPVGTVVTFNYTKQGVARIVPRKLRVLSYFADPYRQITTVEIGCKLTYLEDLKDPINWTALDDPGNEGITEAESEIVTFPIFASSVMVKCLTMLEISATMVPVTNRFSVAEFDFGSGYVSILSDLLVSESYCGYLDYEETLQIINLSNLDVSGPSISAANLIDVGPIGVGDLPGDAVTVSYSTLKLKVPDRTEVAELEVPTNEEPTKTLQPGLVIAPGERTSSSSGSADNSGGDDDGPGGSDSPVVRSTSTTIIPYTLKTIVGKNVVEVPATRVYSVLNVSEETTNYVSIQTKGGKKANVVGSRIINETQSLAAVAGNIIGTYLSNGGSYSGGASVSSTTIETFSYDDEGNEIYRELRRTGDAVQGAGAVGISWEYPTPTGGNQLVTIPVGKVLLEKTIVETTINGNFKKSVTSRYGPWVYSVGGQQTLAEGRNSIQTASQAEALLETALQGEYLLDVTVNSSRSAAGAGSQQGPRSQDASNRQLADKKTAVPSKKFMTDEKDEIQLDSGGKYPIGSGDLIFPPRATSTDDPNSSVSSENQIVLAEGLAGALRRIELSMPYANDDSFFRVLKSYDPNTNISVYSYRSLSSNAKVKAGIFGRIQNRILFGNRNGMSLQVSPEVLPSPPFGAFYFSANGAVTQYRTNGTSWTMDSNGIVASTDAVYWGVAGRSS